jgi:P-type Mg2+ transporter
MEVKGQQTQGAVTFWSVSTDDLLKRLGSSSEGLGDEEARRRVWDHAPRLRRAGRARQVLLLLWAQFQSPIILILLFAASLSFALRDSTDALIILFIVLVSGLLGFWQEWGAADAVENLLALIRIKATVLRGGQRVEVPLEQVVPGEVVILDAGDIVPGDGRILTSRELFVTEATLTGETYPVEKRDGILPDDTPLSRRTNCLFTGTSVVSGTAKLLVVETGEQTEFGRVSQSLRLRPPETEFERGIRRFGYLLLELTLLLVLAVFAIAMFLNRPVLDALLFSLAIAVGLTPQLLPAIISVNLAHGARRMAQQRVIVRRLAAIENFGSMDILCSDKTGTLTQGTVTLHSAVGPEGSPSDKVRLYAYLNAALQVGYANPIDEAIVAEKRDISGYASLDEEPYDFVRKRLSVLVAGEGRNQMITKGAVANVLEVCSHAEKGPGDVVDVSSVRPEIERQHAAFSDQGLRTLAVAYRDLGNATGIGKEQESGMTFLGLLVFDDPLQGGIEETLRRLHDLGISLKVITGDNPLVASHVAKRAGLPVGEVLTGSSLRVMSNEALVSRVSRVQVFAEMEPSQKERVILALKQAGHVVGYMGDGINDASALHAADVGISVANAVDVAKKAAEIILLEKDLTILERGVREGRRTFANTMKYIFMSTSANFGNMFSMAGASSLLPFLPLLPKQILLMNLLTDLPEMAIATDRVDAEMADSPRRWDVGFIRRFMVLFGIISSFFDFLTFGFLWKYLGATPDQFRTGWFLESVISASMIVLVVRTRRRFFESRPSRSLLISTVLVAGLTLLLPYTPFASVLGFVALPAGFIVVLVVIVTLYVLAAEVAKGAFYRSEAKRENRALGHTTGVPSLP